MQVGCEYRFLTFYFDGLFHFLIGDEISTHLYVIEMREIGPMYNFSRLVVGKS